MAQEIALFHSALGLRPAVLDFAAHLRTAGHIVHTPDLFDGEVFDSLDEGSARRDALGVPELMKRAQQAVSNLPENIVYAGFSMGAAPAEFLAATRAGATGVVLMHGALAPQKAGIASWPRSVPAQIHYARLDSLVDVSDINALASAAREAGARVDVFAYAHGGHLFADDASPDYNRSSAWLMEERMLEFLARIDLSERTTVELPVTEREVARSRVVDREVPRYAESDNAAASMRLDPKHGPKAE